LLALTGDKIDNVPGVPGVGEKTAAGLLEEYGSLEGVLAHAAEVKKPKLRENLLANLETVRRGRKLIALFDDLPLPWKVEDLGRKPLDEPKARALFTELEFSRLLSELPRPAPTAPAGKRSTVKSLAELDALVAVARAQPRLGVHVLTTEGAPLRDQLLGVTISLGGAEPQSAYVPIGHRGATAGGDLFAADPLPKAQVLSRLKPLLEDAAIAKDGHELKGQLIALSRAGIALQGLDLDGRLLSYLLDATGRDHDLIVSARERISCELPSLVELTQKSGRGKKSTPLAELPAADVGDVACAQAEGARLLAETLGKELEAEPGLKQLYRELELPLLHVLAGLELRGIALDVKRLQEISVDVTAQADALLKEIIALAGQDFSPASNQQLAEILFDKLGLPVLKRGKTGPSTDQEVLEKLAEQHPLPAKILEHRQLVKLQNTYLDALPRDVLADGRIHTTFDQSVAATGRLSSVNPNLQNIPIRTPLGAKIREAFVAAPGKVLISADYSQIELRVLAHVSEDAVLIDSFLKGEDLHVRTAGETFGVPPAEVTRQQRDIAKMINYGIAYGLSGFGLAQRLGLGNREAQDIIDRYFARYAGVKAWLDGVVLATKKSGEVSTLFGRRRYVPDILSKNPAVRMGAERIAVNTPIQGTAADLVKRAMLRVDVALKEAGLSSSMLLQIHDELVLEGPPEESERASALVRQGMEQAAELKVPLVVELGVGKSWAVAH
ncbi:MAG: DNA polymerase I, partial [Deltaproteobacteria bacterium]|nr:DNA polymerase I [Deltaproteobacteria bacterium]